MAQVLNGWGRGTFGQLAFGEGDLILQHPEQLQLALPLPVLMHKQLQYYQALMQL